MAGRVYDDPLVLAPSNPGGRPIPTDQVQSAGSVRYFRTRSMTTGFLGRWMWQNCPGGRDSSSVPDPAVMMSSVMPGRADSLCVTSPSPSKV